MSEWCRRCARVVDAETCPNCGRALAPGADRVVRGVVRTLRGFIRASDGTYDDLLFVAAEIENGPLSVGDAVECIVDQGPHGPVARKVRRIETRETNKPSRESD